MDKYSALKRYFGYETFRRGQGELIDAVAGGRDALAIMPTGSGKSICFQVPAVMSDGIALVVSPLISLMKDQVAALKAKGIRAAYINSTLTQTQIETVYRNMLAGVYKLAYVAPERLQSAKFIEVAQKLKISLVAVDEAHCISQWGHDFRPSYLKINDFIETLPMRPVIAAFTATATLEVGADIAQSLKLHDPLCLSTGFDRPNLRFEVRTPENKLDTLYRIVSGRKKQSGIVYCNTRRTVERIQTNLYDAGISVTRYHAGLTDEERRRNQDDFLEGRRAVIVATNAFGMGIDKRDVRYVIHYNMPQCLESYYQEAGRAGRDGAKSICLLMYSPDDVHTAKKLIRDTGSNMDLSKRERRIIMRRDFKRLREMIGYCKAPDCLRGYILDYFGQKHAKNCWNCSNCSTII